MKFVKSLRLKLLLAGFLIAFIFLILFGTFLMRSTEAAYQADKLRAMSAQLSLATGNIERNFFQFVRLPQILSDDNRVRQYLLEPSPASETYGRSLSNALSDINMLTYSTNASEYVAKLLLASERHDRYLSIGRINGHHTDRAVFESLCADIGIPEFCNIVETPFQYAAQMGEGHIIPFSEHIYYRGGSTRIGTLYLALSDTLVRDQFEAYLKDENAALYILSGETVYVMTQTDLLEAPGLFDALASAPCTPADSGTFTTGNIAALENQSLVGCRINLLGWTFFQPLSPYQLQMPENAARTIALVLFAAALSVAAVYLMLNHIVAKPVAHIQSQLHALTLGDFSERKPLPEGDEFGLISGEITEMSGAIVQLMRTQRDDEKKRNQLAFRMLQGQINPHFLYNTLNSIRWLGEMNGVAGLGEMTTALMRMLRRVTRISSDFCSLREELEFVKDYEVIQSYRYGNAFRIRYRIENEALLDAQVVKFILQPLVENAIFYGIDPTGCVGIIDIHAFTQADDLFLTVTDNGTGIAPEVLDQLRQRTYRPRSADGASGIALRNIHERLVMEYGKTYGISIRSKLSHYTQITVRIPFAPAPQDKGESHV